LEINMHDLANTLPPFLIGLFIGCITAIFVVAACKNNAACDEWDNGFIAGRDYERRRIGK
jgi:hypothetical protein